MAGVTSWLPRSLLLSARYSDFTIICKDATFHVHKNILGSASKYFTVLFDSSFKESIENTVNFAEDEPEAIGTLLYYLYTGIYVEKTSAEFIKFMEDARLNSKDKEGTVPDNLTGPTKNKPGTVGGAIDNIERHILTYAAADRLDISQVIPKVVEYFEEFDVKTLTKCENFPEYLSMVYENTRQDDAELRLWFTKQSIDVFAFKAINHPVNAIIAANEPVALLVGRHYKPSLEAAQLAQYGIESKRLDLERSNTALQSTLAAVKDSKKALSGQLATMTSELNASKAENAALKEENKLLQKQMATVKTNNERRIRKVMKKVGGMSPGGTYYPGERKQRQESSDDYYATPSKRPRI